MFDNSRLLKAASDLLEVFHLPPLNLKTLLGNSLIDYANSTNALDTLAKQIEELETQQEEIKNKIEKWRSQHPNAVSEEDAVLEQIAHDPNLNPQQQQAIAQFIVAKTDFFRQLSYRQKLEELLEKERVEHSVPLPEDKEHVLKKPHTYWTEA